MCIAAIALAGGQSSRMGTDKALITVNGVPLLQRVCEVSLEVSAKVYVVTGQVERYQHLPLPQNSEFVAEPNPQGPLVGFALGLEHCLSHASANGLTVDWVVLLACDLPNLDPVTLQVWRRQLRQLPEQAIAYLPRSDRGWEPLCGFYRSSCLPALRQFIATGGRSFQQWLERSPVVAVPTPDWQMLLNCNTPNDLTSLLAS